MKNFELKPSTSYHFSPSDYEFILELAKIGHVHILSYQVVLMGIKGYSDGVSFDFKDNVNSEKNCLGLTLPDGWAIEYISGSNEFLKITFGVKH